MKKSKWKNLFKNVVNSYDRGLRLTSTFVDIQKFKNKTVFIKLYMSQSFMFLKFFISIKNVIIFVHI